MAHAKRLALIGVGQVAGHQLRALALCPQWKLVAAADVDTKRQALLPAEVPFYPSAEQLLDAVEADVVLVSTPNRTHFAIGQFVLDRGANLLMEKPCCESREEWLSLIDLARDRHSFFAVAFHAAYARDLQWFQDNVNQLGFELSEITSFSSRFFDPYLTGAGLLPSAGSLGSSWLDSGINALSVIGTLIPPGILRVEESRFTTTPAYDWGDIQSVVDLSFRSSGGFGRGSIETNWTLGIDRKTTRLTFANRDTEVLLDHSNERVVVMHNGRTAQTVNLQTDLPKLVNHYIGVLADVHRLYCEGSSNLPYAGAIHQLVFDAMTASRKNGGA